MRLGDDGFHTLTYCTNIHPATGWPEVRATLERYAPALKARLAPDVPFGVGLRLSDAEARELLEGDRLERFAAWLRDRGLYVATLNGFVYGTFHKEPVKAAVHAPDWRTEERVQYALRLVRILTVLLPAGLDGSISTNPLSYRAWVDPTDTAAWDVFARNVARVAVALARVKRDRGRVLHLDLEPEADGLLETSAELVRFFRESLLPVGAPLLAEELGLSVEESRAALLEHVGVCLDVCHLAVAHEDPAECLDRFAAEGIRVGKVQVSAALEVPLPVNAAERPALGRALEPFADPIYLHQVTQRNEDGGLRRYPDLGDALSSLTAPEAVSWRIHFHVPLFVERYGALRATHDSVVRTLAELRRRRCCRILEIETYTWDVLPAELKTELTDSIAREYAWVQDAFGVRPTTLVGDRR